MLGVLLAVVGCNSGPKAGEELTPEALSEYADVALYPNAKAPDGESRSPHLDEAGDMHYDLVLTSGEPPQAVAQWYEKATGFTAEGSNTNWSLIGQTKKGNEAMISIFRESDYTKIIIKSLAHKK